MAMNPGEALRQGMLEKQRQQAHVSNQIRCGLLGLITTVVIAGGVSAAEGGHSTSKRSRLPAWNSELICKHCFS